MSIVDDTRVIATVQGHAVEAQKVINLLCGLYENGCSSWLEAASCVWGRLPEGTTREDFKARGRLNPDDFATPRMVLPTFEGGLVLMEVEVPVRSKHNSFGVYVDLPSVVRGLEVLAEKYPYQFNNLVEENDDADTADTFAQCVIYGEAHFC